MTPRARPDRDPTRETPVERLPDDVMATLADVAFQGALDVLGQPAQQPNRKWLTVLEQHLASRAQQQPAAIRDLLHRHRGAWRWTRAFAMHLILHEERRLAYVPHQPLRDARWLSSQLTTGRHTATSLATWLARQGHHASEEAIHEAMASLRTAAQTATPQVAARTYLANKTWLERRVVEGGMLDGQIVDELRRLGCLCDRSTVAWWRRTHGLSAAWKRGTSLQASPPARAPAKRGRPPKD